MAHPGLYSEIRGTENMAWGFAVTAVRGGLPRVLQVHSLLVNLKPKSRN